MQRKSHICLGEHLARLYLNETPGLSVWFFLLGCRQPDRNPATYLKGSFRFQWFRGHNYPNSRQYLHRIAGRLERRRIWNLHDYYTLGKLIHYTADAFTYAHNPGFPGNLALHRLYEEALQQQFVICLQQAEPCEILTSGMVGDCITALHLRYSTRSSDPIRDCRYILKSCCSVMSLLLRPVFVQ